jgi:5-methyltetrahydropteroyltriglutamate--homocysteine methyltransferase
MRIVCANHSSYPRVAEGPKGQRLRRAYARRETGELDDAGYRDIARDYAAEIIKEQEDAGCDVVTDGIVSWYDLINRPATNLAGVRSAGIVRWFDTNTYVRQPEIVAHPAGSFGLAAEFDEAVRASTKPVKAVVPGPYTLARHSLLTGNGDLTSLAAAYADATAAEIEALANAGCRLLQIEEPSLLRFPDDADLVRNALIRATKERGEVKVSLVTYFGDAMPIYGEFLKMPVDMLGFDLTYGPRVAELLTAEPPDVPVAIGALDGRNTKLDDTEQVASVVGRIAEAFDTKGVEELHLQTSCGLEFLPRDRAKRKLERMREIADVVNGVRT